MSAHGACSLFVDRYEKRHKNLAAHVSPAFRVELGDVVTVGAYEKKTMIESDADMLYAM